MNRSLPIALWLIVLLLAGFLWFEHGRPILSLAVHDRAYLAAAQECHEATADWQALQRITGLIDAVAAGALRHTGAVAKIACYERDRLRNMLLADGVSSHTLRRLDLEARHAADVDVSYFVQGLSTPQ